MKVTKYVRKAQSLALISVRTQFCKQVSHSLNLPLFKLYGGKIWYWRKHLLGRAGEQRLDVLEWLRRWLFIWTRWRCCWREISLSQGCVFPTLLLSLLLRLRHCRGLAAASAPPLASEPQHSSFTTQSPFLPAFKAKSRPSDTAPEEGGKKRVKLHIVQLFRKWVLSVP